jgi:hypothetical protein
VRGEGGAEEEDGEEEGEGGEEGEDERGCHALWRVYGQLRANRGRFEGKRREAKDIQVLGPARGRYSPHPSLLSAATLGRRLSSSSWGVSCCLYARLRAADRLRSRCSGGGRGGWRSRLGRRRARRPGKGSGRGRSTGEEGCGCACRASPRGLSFCRLRLWGERSRRVRRVRRVR